MSERKIDSDAASDRWRPAPPRWEKLFEVEIGGQAFDVELWQCYFARDGERCQSRVCLEEHRIQVSALSAPKDQLRSLCEAITEASEALVDDEI